MINPNEDYEQGKVKGSEKHTIIIDERETGETDELDPHFHETAPGSLQDPEVTPESGSLDGEGIDETRAGLNVNSDKESERSMPAEDPELNRSVKDDLSLNQPQNDVF